MNERAAGWETFVAEDTDHVGKLGPTTDRQGDWKKIARKPPSAITGYTGASHARQLYRALCGKTDLGRYKTAEEAAHVYDQFAIERNIAAGYDKHRLNVSKARAKRPRAQDNRQGNILET